MLADCPTGGAVVFVEDISERRRVDQVRTDFVANICHELKTPIGALSVLAETLEGETDPATVERIVARMLGEADRASSTIDDLMELSQIELGGDTRPSTVCVADVVRRGDRSGHRAGCSSQHHDPDSRPGRATVSDDRLVVEGDRRQLVSAVGNLVENAVKYSEPGGSVQVRVDHDADMVEIAVVDQGVGIPQRDLDRVFERFYRVDRARSRATGGTGLGLSIVRHVAARHGGEVTVSSTEGEGSTFTLRLPAMRAIADVGEHRAAAVACTAWYQRIDGRSGVSQPSILVVEDEPSFVDALQVGLSREGFHVEVATDGAEALERFPLVQPDLVLLDLMLPRVSGIDVCRQIRQISTVPIIMVTAKSSEIDTVVGLEVGADDYVTKPYRVHELVARIRAQLRRVEMDSAVEQRHDEAIRVGEVVLDPDEHRVTVSGDEVTLPLKEFEVLHLLLVNVGRVLTRDTLIDRVWGSDYVGDTKTLDVHIKRLRSKIEVDPDVARPDRDDPRPRLQVRTSDSRSTAEPSIGSTSLLAGGPPPAVA